MAMKNSTFQLSKFLIPESIFKKLNELKTARQNETANSSKTGERLISALTLNFLLQLLQKLIFAI